MVKYSKHSGDPGKGKLLFTLALILVVILSLFIAVRAIENPKENRPASAYGECGVYDNGDFACFSLTECKQCQDYVMVDVPVKYCPLGSLCNPLPTPTPTPTPKFKRPTPTPTVFFAPTSTPPVPVVCTKDLVGRTFCGGLTVYECTKVGRTYVWKPDFNCEEICCEHESGATCDFNCGAM